jgi:hypothetical protein
MSGRLSRSLYVGRIIEYNMLEFVDIPVRQAPSSVVDDVLA